MSSCPWCIEFVKKNWNNALAASRKFRIHPVILLSHSAKETGWGRSSLAVNHNNYFGIMAAGSTNPYWKGKYYQSSTGTKWRTYDKPLDSYMDYGRLISTSDYYKNAYSVSMYPDRYALEISRSAYMTDADNRTKYQQDFVSINKTIAGIIAAEKLKSSMSFDLFGFTALLALGVIIIKNSTDA